MTTPLASSDLLELDEAAQLVRAILGAAREAPPPSAAAAPPSVGPVPQIPAPPRPSAPAITAAPAPKPAAAPAQARPAPPRPPAPAASPFRSPGAPAAPPAPRPSAPPARAEPRPPEAATAPAATPRPPAPAPAADADAAPRAAPRPAPAPEPWTRGYRSERLEAALAGMCRRGGFLGAVIADVHGLPLAEHNSPVNAELVAAFTTVLSLSIDKAGKLLGEHHVNNMSLDVNFTDKAVLRRFVGEGMPYFLMVICPQAVDERSEIEVSVELLTKVLTSN